MASTVELNSGLPLGKIAIDDQDVEKSIKFSGEFDIQATYYKFLEDDPDMTMPVAAIESLVALLSRTKPSTASELIQLLAQASDTLKSSVPNSISLSAGCDLFQRFVLRNIHVDGDWEAILHHLVANGRLFADRAKASRDRISEIGLKFIRDDDTILVHSYSRAVVALLLNAFSHHVRFKVLIAESRPSNQGYITAKILRDHGIPVSVIIDGAIGWAISKIDKVFVGAEGVAESGGVINHIGTFQTALIAKYSHIPFYVVAESHKFVRLFPLSVSDLPNEVSTLQFSASQEKNMENEMRRCPSVDFTSEDLITALITDIGVLTPSGVSEELIKMWYD